MRLNMPKSILATFIVYSLVTVNAGELQDVAKSRQSSPTSNNALCKWVFKFAKPKNEREAFLITIKLAAEHNMYNDFTQSSLPIPVHAAWLPANELYLQAPFRFYGDTEDVVSHLPEEIKSNFVKTLNGVTYILVPFDPYKMQTLKLEKSRKRLDAPNALQVYPGNSRSKFIFSISEPNNPAAEQPMPFSIKMSTDHPHMKIRTLCKMSIACSSHALDRVEYIESVEKLYALPTDGPILLRERFAVFDKSLTPQDFHGYSLRDLRPLADGHIYLPGTAVGVLRPDLLLELAKQMGRTKAYMILNYGISPENTQTAFHTQQVFMQLDVDGQPTGRLALQDLGDTVLVTPFASGFDFYEDHADSDYLFKSQPINEIRLTSSDIIFKQEELDVALISQMRFAFVHAFVNYFQTALGVDLSVDSKNDIQHLELMQEIRLNQYFLSAEGQKEIEEYRAKHLRP